MSRDQQETHNGSQSCHTSDPQHRSHTSNRLYHTLCNIILWPSCICLIVLWEIRIHYTISMLRCLLSFSRKGGQHILAIFMVHPPLSYSAGRRVKVKSIPCEPTEGMDIQLTGIRRWKGNCDLLLLPFPKQNQRLSTFPGNLFFSTRIFSSWTVTTRISFQYGMWDDYPKSDTDSWVCSRHPISAKS